MPLPADLVWRDHLSPNFGPRRGDCAVDILVIHYTGMENATAALDRLSDPTSGVSCHWLIDEDGTIWRLVDERDRAWHAGIGYWAGTTDINSRSIGIELVNPGHALGYRPFPLPQMQALVDLSSAILTRHPIPPARILGHSDIAPDRKQDPGELFDWAWLAAQGIGFWPQPGHALGNGIFDAGAAFVKIGYKVPETGLDSATILAFQRRFLSTNLSGELDLATCRRLNEVWVASDQSA